MTIDLNLYVTVLHHLSPITQKCSNTLKQFVGNLATNYFSGFDHCVGLNNIRIYMIMSSLLMVCLRNTHCTKMKFFIKDFFSKCDQIRSFLRIWSHLLKKSSMQNFIFCVVNKQSKHVLKNIELIAIEISIVKPSIMSGVFVTRENIRT